jgi:DNA/RNA-binding domain of Phe-tRNA-synthetase-like protein
MLALSDAWISTYPNASVGVLEMRDVVNPERSAELDSHAEEVERSLRSQFAGADRTVLRALPTIRAYTDYYRRFKKTYHVQLQLESVTLRNRSIPEMPGLVKAMVAAELNSQLLTAGHDVTALDGQLVASVARGTEQYMLLNGSNQQLKPGDMCIADRTATISSVLYGPDYRTRLQAGTRNACYTVYGVPGIAPAAIEAHLGDIRDAILLFAPEAQVEQLAVHGG